MLHPASLKPSHWSDGSTGNSNPIWSTIAYLFDNFLLYPLRNQLSYRNGHCVADLDVASVAGPSREM